MSFIRLMYYFIHSFISCCASDLIVKCTFQRIPGRRVPQLTPGASGSAVGSNSFTVCECDTSLLGLF